MCSSNVFSFSAQLRHYTQLCAERLSVKGGWLSFQQWKVNYLNPSYMAQAQRRPMCKKWWPHSLFIHFPSKKSNCWKSRHENTKDRSKPWMKKQDKQASQQVLHFQSVEQAGLITLFYADSFCCSWFACIFKAICLPIPLHVPSIQLTLTFSQTSK